ncbi:hypothetical protein CEQ90_14790 [Lewinellaceae bacterium SD302]|nr:hypothetical protein CEQ90_14790 [Lewinellaceae bacterium SD302]
MMNDVTSCPPGDKLPAYAQGKLSGAEQHKVEQHLLDCPLCDAAVEGFVEYGVRPDQLTYISKMTQSALTKARTKKEPAQPSINLNWWPYLAAAAIVLLLVFAWSGYRDQQAPQRLFAEFFDPIPQADFSAQRAVVSIRQPNGDELLEQALAYHLEGNYPYALTAWRAFLDEYENQIPRAYLYAANAAMATGQDELATYYLQQLPPDEGGTLGEEIMWYRALLALKMDGPQVAAELLRSMPEQLQNVDVQDKKEALLRKLEGI